MSVRYDWYQSDSKVVVTILLKDALKKNLDVKINKEKIIVTSDDYILDLILHRPIDPERSSYKTTPSKVEISLAKESGERWECLEKKLIDAPSKENKMSEEKWDKLAKEIAKQEDEEARGEEAIRNLFKKIYTESTEEVKRAMNKSFLESSGTVLSTDWKTVKENKVEATPPNGTEFKTWSK